MYLIPFPGIPHPQGPGEWEPQICDVKFRLFVPHHIERSPYVFFTSHGTHTHQPPPPVRTPQRYLQDIRRLIDLAGAEELTFGTCIRYVHNTYLTL
jgi:hypothetical protein